MSDEALNRGWLETLDREQMHGATPTPNGREDNPDRPQLAAADGDTPPLEAPPLAPARFRKLATRHLGQWTARPPNRVDSLGFSGTDLGIAFAHRDRLWFLFGDSQSVFDYASDSIAVTARAPLPAAGLPKLDWITRASGLFAPIRVPGVNLGFMNVAVEGVSIGDRAYAFFASAWSGKAGQHLASVLAHSDTADLGAWVVDHVVPSRHFDNLSALVEGGWVYLWGSGEFRESDVYLARVRVDTLTDRDAWEYFAGDGPEGPTFVHDEASAQPVVVAGCVGELSVRKHEALGLFLLAYNCEWPRGVFLQTAEGPAGPWSAPISIFDPWRDRGYEHFIHVSPSVSGRDDGLSDPGREDDSGGEYGPYLVPDWFTEGPDGSHAIVYTLSSWNPYQVHLMQTTLIDAAQPLPPFAASDIATRLLVPPAALTLSMQDQSSWSQTGDGFEIAAGIGGGLELASDAPPLGTAATGTFWHDFQVDSSVTSLSFEIRGGDAEVLLVADDEVVRRARGRDDDVWRPVVFQLAELRGQHLRIALYDQSSESAVQVRNLSLQ